MAFSSSWNYTNTYTAADLMALALRRLGVLDPDEPINTTEQTNALQVLNLVLKEISLQGTNIYLRDTMYLMLTSKTKPYYTTASDYLAFGFALITQSNGAAISGATTIVLDSVSGIVTGQYIFIKQSDNTMLATTVNGAPAGNTVTLTNALTASVNDNAYVYLVSTTDRFTGVLNSVLSARTMEPTSDSINYGENGRFVPMDVVGDVAFHSNSSIGQTGRPLQLYHIRKPTSSELHIWPLGGQPTIDVIELVNTYPIMDLDTTTDNLYLPPDGFNAVAWQLAAEMASEYGLSEAEQRRLWQIASAKMENFFDAAVEDASVIFEGGGPRQ